MPCTISREEELFYEQERNERRFKKRLTDNEILEEVACSACRTLFQTGKLSKAPLLVQQWWKLHQVKDAETARYNEKKRQEAVTAQKALKKLTPAERKALGIK